MAAISLQQLFPGVDLTRYAGGPLRGSDGVLYDINSTLSNEEGGLGQMMGLQNGSINVTDHSRGMGDGGGGNYYEFGKDGNLIAQRQFDNYTHNVRDAVGMSAMVLAPILGGAMLGAGAGAGSGGAEAVGTGMGVGDATAAGYAGLDAGSAATLGGGASGAYGGGVGLGTGAMGAGAGAGVGAVGGPGSAGWGADLGTEMGAVGGSGTPAGIGGAATSGLGSLGNLGGSGVGVKDLIGPAASLGSGIIGANAAGNAADAQLQATREAAALNEPFRQAGISGMNRLQDLLGLSSNTGAAGYGSMAKNFSMADYQADPGYQFRQQQGEQAIQRAASAAGRSDSGRSYKDLMSFNSGLASQEYGNAYNRYNTNRAAILNPLQSLMGAGQSASGTIGDYTIQGGNAQAAGQIGSANAISNAIGQGLGNYQQNQLLSMLQNRQSGSAYAN